MPKYRLMKVSTLPKRLQERLKRVVFLATGQTDEQDMVVVLNVLARGMAAVEGDLPLMREMLEMAFDVCEDMPDWIWGRFHDGK